jgi:chromosome segregation ATPase
MGISERLHTEVKKCTHLIGQVQEDTEAELVAVKRNIQVVSAGLEDRLDQHSSQTNSILDELTSTVIANKSEVDTNVERVARLDREIRHVKDAMNENDAEMKRQQKENEQRISQRVNKEKLETESQFAPLHSEINALKSRVSEKERVVRTADSAESREADNIVPLSPTAVARVENANSVNQVSINTSCACMSSSCKVCDRNGVNGSNVAVTERHSTANSYLSNSNFPLPLFDENSDVNPVFHLRQLDEFMKLKGIPRACQLAAPYRSLD